MNGSPTSPSGRYLVSVTCADRNGLVATVRVHDSKSGVDYRDPTEYQLRERYFVRWEAGDRLLVYSADIGTFTYAYCEPCNVESQFKGEGPGGWILAK